MSKRYRARRRQRYHRRCQNCNSLYAIGCYLPEPPRFTGSERAMVERAPDERLCPTCAADAGYCCSCGDFWAGISSFDFVHPGLCDHCHDQIQQDCFEPEDDCEDYYDPYDCVP